MRNRIGSSFLASSRISLPRLKGGVLTDLRASAVAAAAGMAAGFLSHLALYVAGFIVHGRFQAVRIAHLDPLIPGLVISLVFAVGVTLLTKPPAERLVRRFFHRAGQAE